MSVYGWYIWTRKKEGDYTPITRVSRQEWGRSFLIFVGAALLVLGVYLLFEMLTSWINYLDILTTGIAFVGMWLMAKRKLAHWLVLLVANILSVPLYFVKGYSFTSLYYIFLTIMAVLGYLSWKKHLHKSSFAASE
jgi:Nicotinamide mononucleotide transporter